MNPASFRERLGRDRFPITYEAISPRGADVAPHVAAVANLPALRHLAAINITNNPSARVRIDPAAFGHLLMDHASVDVIAHVTCRDDNLSGIQRWLFGAWALGIRNLLVMTGDHPSCGDYPEEERVDSVNALELVAGIKRFLSKGFLIPDVVSAGTSRYANRLDLKTPKRVAPVDFFVGGPLIPWRNNELSYAKAKREAGVDFFQTQITWDEKPVLDFVERAEEAKVLGAGVPVLVGTSPLRDERTLEFMAKEIPHVVVSPAVRQRLKSASSMAKESVEVAVELAHRLRDGAKQRGLKTPLGLHVLPINDDALGSQIVERAAA